MDRARMSMEEELYRKLDEDGGKKMIFMNKNKNKKFIVDPNTNSFIIQIHQINQ